MQHPGLDNLFHQKHPVGEGGPSFKRNPKPLTPKQLRLRKAYELEHEKEARKRIAREYSSEAHEPRPDYED